MCNSFFTIIVVGVMLSLFFVLVGTYFLIKRFGRRKTEIDLTFIGKLKTTETGLVLIFIGIFLFAYSSSNYLREKRSELVKEELTSARKNVESISLQLKAVMTKAAKRLWMEYKDVIAKSENLEKTRNGEKPWIRTEKFNRVHALIGFFQEIDPLNGHALYFSGEVKRWEGHIDESHHFFYKFIEVFDSLPENQKAGSTGSESCYENENGYCRQRSAWIRHLLALDFFEAGNKERDIDTKKRFYEESLMHTVNALRDYPQGFVQFIPTQVIKTKLKKELDDLNLESIK